MLATPIATAASGMMSAVNKLDVSAQRVAQWGTPLGKDVDLVQETVAQIQAKTEFKASAKVLKTADEMLGTLLDIKA
ncbi:hypothetical protein C5708_15855 [Caulobacter sp. CCUG 60055]|uniref:flagellar basal body rod C-terminal domain-containing protein n=1 Tax=Caulobacter sp. CCUG 60055 TaxID=2100090 RepID=UPI001FA715CF|nr:flagellar basal body rod C-terminal domain-containing protein [Caulobacter sp. CCUG 60055]MBQ1542201.1 flagellar hook protein FlgE [Caulobacteraceae bacterium]MCI3181721.1 hypothetical protein [Caulobacter sp. CCUG 60055]